VICLERLKATVDVWGLMTEVLEIEFSVAILAVDIKVEAVVSVAGVFEATVTVGRFRLGGAVDEAFLLLVTGSHVSVLADVKVTTWEAVVGTTK